ncbi:hypothetical protein FRC12_005107 [Ceratobasidium sp. 428]|nr:hypothetical protein FRC12_005107 [Ceratobasidium sp. 428]
MNAAQVQALATPELVCSILDALLFEQVAQVLGVNKLFFRVGTPFIWGDLKGLDPLLSLLCQEPLPPLPRNSWVEVRLNKDDVAAGMPRLVLYARLVHKLQAYRNSTRGYCWRGLCHLIPFAPLLPHMNELSFKWRCDNSHSEGFSELVSLLCSSSCTIIRSQTSAARSVPWMTTSHSLRALSALQSCAANLTTLDFFVKADIPSWSGWSELAAGLAEMAALHSLGLGVDTLSQQVLAAIGQLPLLKLLTLRFHRFAQPGLRDLNVSSSWFQQLSNLAVYSASAESLFHLVQHRPLISGLQSAFLEVTEGSRIDRLLERAFQMLCDHAPRLDMLEICFPDNGDDAYEMRSQNLMPILSQIPLKKLALQNVYVSSDEVLEDFFWGCSIWQGSMTHLLMPCQIVTAAGLQALAGFHLLKVLCVNLDDNSPAPEVNPTLPPINHKALRLESHFLLHKLLPDQVEALAWFLLSCWGDVTVVMTRLPLDQEDKKDRLDYWVYRHLLHKLAAIKGRKPSEDTAVWK